MAVAAVVAAIFLASGVGFAKASLDVPYPFDVMWPAALRFVRVDNNWKLGEQSREAGFLRFELIDDKQKLAATLEIIGTIDRTSREAVKLQLSAPGLSGYRESILLERLARKVREEQGPPADPKRGAKPGRPDGSRQDDGARRDDPRRPDRPDAAPDATP